MRAFLNLPVSLGLALFLTGCVHTNAQKTTLTMEAPPPGATVLFMEPDVELRLLTTGGATEPRADWTDSAKQNLTLDIENALAAKGAKVQEFSTQTPPSAHVMQLIHLHEVVGNTILGNATFAKLPNKSKIFDWSLGPGVKEIADSYHADYALFLFAHGTYASSGRVALAIVASLARVSIPLGHQAVFASLVDLRNGNVAWINTAATGESNDISTPSGAASVTKALMEDIPLGHKS